MAVDITLLAGKRNFVTNGMLQLQGGVGLSTSLFSIVDQSDTVSPLSLSTTVVGIGRTGADGLVHWRRSSDGNAIAAMGVRPGFADWYFEGNNVNFRSNATGFFFGGGSTWVTPSARLHVRGDGTNPIARFENISGSLVFVVNPNVGVQAPSVFLDTITAYSSSLNGITLPVSNFNTSFAQGAGALNFRPINITYTINNSGAQTGTATGIFLDATETALNGMTHNLMNLQVGGSSIFRVDKDGGVFCINTIQTVDINLSGGQQAIWNSSGRILLTNNSFNDFNRLQFGGTTNLFPAIKRVNESLEVRLADDSSYADLACAIFSSISGRINMSASGLFGIKTGTGSPEGVISAGVGSLYLRTDGGANTTLYVKESGTGNTGWVAK